jgi:hypothetical protein
MIRKARAPSRTPGHAARGGCTSQRLAKTGRDQVQISWNPKSQRLTESKLRI